MKNKLDLLNELTSMKNYVEDNIESIPEAKARQAVLLLKDLWRHIERRKGVR